MDRLTAGCPSGLEPPPAAAEAADPSAFVWRGDDGLDHLDVMITGARCAACIQKIEAAMRAIPGMVSARLNLSTQRLRLVFTPGAFDARQPLQVLAGLGYGARPFDVSALAEAEDREGRFLLVCLGVAAFAMMNVMLLSVSVWAGAGQDLEPATQQLFLWISALIAVPAGLYAGRPFFRSAFAALRTGHANMDVPISLAICLALGMSVFETAIGGGHAYFDGVVGLEFFLLIGRYLDHRLRHRARQAAQDLMRLQATSAQKRLPDGTLVSIPARQVQVDDHILVAPGERAPVDGVVISGQSLLDQSLATGETAPVSAAAGTVVQAGVINLDHPLVIRATAIAENSFLAELARLMEMGEQSKSRFMRMADTAARLYVPVVHTGAVLTLLVWWLVLGASFHTGLMYATALLIITCPCAMGLAAPAVQVVATGRLFKSGVFVRSGDALERLSQIDTVVFDKTGTLTLGRPQWRNVDEISMADQQLAACLARASRHPLARAVVRMVGPGPVADGVSEHPGQGLAAVVEGIAVKLGSRAFAAPDHSAPDDNFSSLWLSRGPGQAVRFTFADDLRPDAAEVVAALVASGMDVRLLSGDTPGPVADVAARVGIRDARARQTPADKIAALEALRADGRRVLMVGDGLNDAPALSAAHVSATPASASDIAQTAADLVIQGQALGPLLLARTVAQQAQARMRENFAFSALYNIVAASLAVTGQVTPLIAAIAMSSSSLVVMANALRLRR